MITRRHFLAPHRRRTGPRRLIILVMPDDGASLGNSP